MEKETPATENEIDLELGCIIKVQAPLNSDLNDKVFFVDYLDESRIRLINDTTLDETIIRIDDGVFGDETIEGISILDVPEESGYARQNELLPGKWITIRFGGNIPETINALITDLEEDMIELKTYPDKETLYIDFGYKGIPLNLPIESIDEFNKPESSVADEMKNEVSTEEQTEQPEQTDQPEETTQTLEKQENIFDEFEEEVDDTDVPDKTREELKRELKQVIFNADDIQFGEELEEISEYVPVAAHEIRFGIETQTNDLLDDLLSQIPQSERRGKNLKKIHLLVERFKELRKMFSTLTDDGDLDIPLKKSADYRPLSVSLMNLNKKISWLIPIIKQKKRLYKDDENKIPEEDEENDTEIVNLSSDLQDIMEIMKNYKQNTVPDRQNKYKYLIKTTSRYYEPVDIPYNLNETLIEKKVTSNIESVVSNNNEFQSTVFKDNQVLNEKYLVQRNIVGLTNLHMNDLRNKHAGVKRVNLTQNESLALSGFLQLPEIFVRFSKINMPNTNIFDKVKLHNNYLLLNYYLKTLKNVESHLINDETNELYFDQSNYLKETRSYIYETDKKYTDRDVDDDYKNFLNLIIPRTRYVFHLLREKIENKYSFDKILEYLETFLIYHDDLTFQQYKIMNSFVYKNILELKQEFVKKHREYRSFYNHEYTQKGEIIRTGETPSYLFELMTSDSANNEAFSSYSLKNETTSEFLNKMLYLDFGNLYCLGLSLTQLELSQPLDMENLMNEADELSVMDDDADKKESCQTLTLAKQYIDIDELREDDESNEVYFDKKYDPTRYEIIDEYKNEREAMPQETFVDFLISKLQENVGLERNLAIQEAMALIEGKRRVMDGDYCFLIDESNKYRYFKRVGNNWVQQEELKGKSIDQVMFCNLKNSCISIKNVCKNVDDEAKTLKEKLEKEILDHFEDKYHLSSAELKESLEMKYRYYLKRNMKMKTIRQSEKWEKDIIFYELGETILDDSLIRSPHENLLFLILGQSDMIKKNKNIQLFVTNFCREANLDSDETNHWYYCNDTGEPLMPTFYYELSIAFFEGNYNHVLEKICAERGTLSDDGDKVVDKHSGFTIKNIQLDTSEGYDEAGFKIVSRSVLEKDIFDILEEEKENRPTTMKSDQAKYFDNIVQTLNEVLGIVISGADSFIISNCITQLNIKATRAKYKKFISKRKKKITYENFYDDIAIMYVLIYYLIGLQTSIPSVKTSKIVPNCKKSFSGFPTQNDTDFSSLKYLICASLKIRTSARPWNRLPRYTAKNVEVFTGKLIKFINSNKIVEQDSVRERMLEKREYLLTNTEKQLIPQEYHVNKWVTFLPPLTNINVPTRNVSDDYRSRLITNITRGNDIQFEQIGALQGKIYYFSILIQQLIQKIVKKNMPILKDMNESILLQNSCCNEGIQKTIQYFLNKDKKISSYNDNVKEFEELKRYVEISGKAQQIFIPFDTKIKYPLLSNDFDEETIYRGFIQYGKFNTGIDLEFNIKSIVGENVSEFRSIDDLQTKISILKREGKDYSLERFQQLLVEINKKQGVNMFHQEPVYNSRTKLERVIGYLKSKDSVLVCNTDILTKLEEASVDNFEATIEPDDDRVIELLTFLKQETDSYKEEIIDFMQVNGVSENIEKMLDNMDNWNERINNIYMSNEDETASAIFTFFKTEIKNIMVVYPNIILNSVDLNDVGVPNHWKLIDVHVKDVKQIISNDTKEFTKFFTDDIIHPILIHMKKASDDILMLIENTPFLANLEYKGRIMPTLINGKVVRHLMKYYYMCCLKMYVNSLELKITIDGQEETLENLLDPYIAEAVDENVRTQIIKGKRRSVENKLAQLLNIFITSSYKVKNILDISNKDIKTHVLKSKEKEKSKITKRLGDMSTEEREVENLLKNHRIGRWNLGQTRALFEYDGEQYEKERLEAEQDLIAEYRTGKLDGVTKDTMEIFKLDYIEQELHEQRMATEISDMFRLMGDDDDYANGLDGDEMFI